MKKHLLLFLFIIVLLAGLVLGILLSASKSFFQKRTLSSTPVSSGQNTTSSVTSLHMFPVAQPGMKRFVINLPTLENESDARIQLIVGETMFVDCNQHSLGGSLEEKTLDGWGYTYFELVTVTGILSTKMACPGQSQYEEFVTLGGEPVLHRYNSKLPVVVYVPNDLEVYYRVWITDITKTKATEE